MRIGVLGAGKMGAFHARTLSEIADVAQVLVADPDGERAVALAESMRATAVGSVDELLGAGVDAAVIASSTDTHASLIHACLDAGVATFCEKPIALDLEQTYAVIEHVERAGGLLQIGFQRRFDAGYRKARELIQGGALGRVYTFRMAGHDPAPPPDDYVPTSGGIFRDLHIHDFDAVRFLFGIEVEEVYASGAVLVSDFFAQHDDVDTTALVLRLADGTLGVLTGMRRNGAGYDVRAELFGSRGSVAVGLGPRTPLRSVEPDMPPIFEHPFPNFLARFGDAYRAELAHFVRFARGQAENPCTPADGLEALRLAVAAERSRSEARPVLLSEVEQAPMSY